MRPVGLGGSLEGIGYDLLSGHTIGMAFRE